MIVNKNEYLVLCLWCIRIAMIYFFFVDHDELYDIGHKRAQNSDSGMAKCYLSSDNPPFRTTKQLYKFHHKSISNFFCLL